MPRESLISVTLHTDTTAINACAFYECSNLTSIIIPEGVASIGGSAFRYCDNLETVTIDSDDIYEDLTSYIACGSLIANDNTNTIRVIASINDSGLYTNTYLNGSTFSRSQTAEDGYYVFTRN